MIYLIGGAPRCGKTTIAKKLSKKLQIPWLSADTIEGIVFASTPAKDVSRLFPKGVIRKKTGQSNDLMYSKYSTKQITDLYIRQSRTSWPAIEAVVEQEIKEGNDYIIEGHQVHPQLMSKLIKKYGRKNIRALVVTRFEVDKIVEGCLKHKAKNDWFVQKTRNKATYYKMAEMISGYSEFFQAEAKKYKIKMISTDSGFNQQLQKAVRLLGN